MKTFIRKSRILVLAFFAMPFLSVAQDGSLDPSFGIGGIVTTDFSTNDDYGNTVAIQANGKIVVGGYSHTALNGFFGLTRYNIDGSLDTAFDSDGKVTTANGIVCQIKSIALQSDGKIIAAGSIDDSFAIVRYNTDGSRDSSFGTAGIAMTGIGISKSLGESVAIQTNGKIVVAGYTRNGIHNDFALVRYNKDGSLDPSFGTAGIVITTMGTYSSRGMSVALQANGRIVVAGFAFNGLSNDIAIACYKSDGSLDLSFGSGGIATTDLGDYEYGVSVVFQADSRIIVAGRSEIGSKCDIAMVRYNDNGSLDSAFGTSGIVTTGFGSRFTQATSLAIQADGKIVVAGSFKNVGSTASFGLVRYHKNGMIDLSFGISGAVTTFIGSSNASATSVAIQADGKIVAVGACLIGINRDFALARYINGSVGINALGMANNEIGFYPNPAQDILHIQGAAIGSSIALYDMQGRVLKSEELQSSTPQIDMRQLPKGNYLLRIISPAGEVGSAKVLKE